MAERWCKGSREWLARLVLAVALIVVGQSAGAQPTGDYQSSVRIDGGVTATARNGNRATNEIGTPQPNAPTSVYIGGPVDTTATSGSASTRIGGNSRPGSTSIRQGVTNQGDLEMSGDSSANSVTVLPGASAIIGGCGRTQISGDVLVANGELELGCTCVGRRNGRCCVEFHTGFCVLHITPPGKHGCPPRYIYAEGLCRLFSDFDHSVD
ncbi:hypothetical protein HL658_27535 [Azospirillum sp. RWY-5-1]|uniref:Uncharacterized protein n=1 Tax=Azospirillum oleiclasticum TaxID=2735135 RepID=A0ABX2TKY1_9PROT|nr:hypothetical protein [Azospirillum oleiclasticum]NYZ16311.1 hypothetical protein [Azospirillum oleiclasticum]NYZ23798.1 hypothetical protein [Azospirillum oleiclasticum]